MYKLSAAAYGTNAIAHRMQSRISAVFLRIRRYGTRLICGWNNAIELSILVTFFLCKMKKSLKIFLWILTALYPIVFAPLFFSDYFFGLLLPTSAVDLTDIAAHMDAFVSVLFNAMLIVSVLAVIAAFSMPIAWILYAFRCYRAAVIVGAVLELPFFLYVLYVLMSVYVGV